MITFTQKIQSVRWAINRDKDASSNQMMHQKKNLGLFYHKAGVGVGQFTPLKTHKKPQTWRRNYNHIVRVGGKLVINGQYTR